MARKYFTLAVVVLLAGMALGQENTQAPGQAGAASFPVVPAMGASLGAFGVTGPGDVFAIGDAAFGAELSAANPGGGGLDAVSVNTAGTSGGDVGWGLGEGLPQKITTPGIYQGLWPTAANTGRLHDGPTSLRIITENMLGGGAANQQNTRLAIAALVMGAGGGVTAHPFISGDIDLFLNPPSRINYTFVENGPPEAALVDRVKTTTSWLKSAQQEGSSLYQEALDGSGFWRTSDHYGKFPTVEWNLNLTPEQMLKLGGTPYEGGNFWVFKKPVTGFFPYYK